MLEYAEIMDCINVSEKSDFMHILTKFPPLKSMWRRDEIVRMVMVGKLEIGLVLDF